MKKVLEDKKITKFFEEKYDSNANTFYHSTQHGTESSVSNDKIDMFAILIKNIEEIKDISVKTNLNMELSQKLLSDNELLRKKLKEKDEQMSNLSQRCKNYEKKLLQSNRPIELQSGQIKLTDKKNNRE